MTFAGEPFPEPALAFSLSVSGATATEGFERPRNWQTSTAANHGSPSIFTTRTSASLKLNSDT